MSKYVYFFGDGKADGRTDMKELLGGKGANLAEMTNIGLPVPAGFTITTEVCNYYTAHDKSYPAGLEDEIRATGVGWALAVGRIGSILGPAVGGILLSTGLDIQNIFLVGIVPPLVAAGAYLAMGKAPELSPQEA